MEYTKTQAKTNSYFNLHFDEQVTSPLVGQNQLDFCLTRLEMNSVHDCELKALTMHNCMVLSMHFRVTSHEQLSVAEFTGE